MIIDILIKIIMIIISTSNIIIIIIIIILPDLEDFDQHLNCSALSQYSKPSQFYHHHHQIDAEIVNYMYMSNDSWEFVFEVKHRIHKLENLVTLWW